MYPPNAKLPPVRPRSSLSYSSPINGTSRRKSPTNAVLTLIGFCIFLLVICLCLLGALVYVGRSLVSESDSRLNFNTSASSKSLIFGSNYELSSTVIDINDNESVNKLCDELRPKQRVVFRPNQVARELTEAEVQKRQIDGSARNKGNKDKEVQVSPEIMTASKILNKISFRLPREIRPKNYQLRLYPNLKEKVFTGKVAIRLEVLQPISFIPVHSKRLTVSTEEFFKLDKDGRKVDAVKPSLTFEYPAHEYWITEFENELDVGEYLLQLAFNGSLTDRIVGFYQSSYLDKATNETRWIATSKFEPTYARQAFPCFDEPSMKAPFKITLVRPTGDSYSALSNMNVESEEPIDGDLTEVNFAESVPMSTYLACFIVSDFQPKSKQIETGGIGENFEMRVFATPGQLDKVDFARDTGAGITEFYIQYFQIEYPLPKLDMVAIPDFVSGAMEHWGLVTFRETALLYHPAISSTSNKQRVATVVGHELAHMWFGNLVTMKWWNDLWLNEGFASYIEYKGVNKVYPSWKMLDQFIIEDLHGVMKLDATLASHPIVQTVESPDQITELFDSITYSKGASIIRMLEDFVEPEKFREAVTNYLNRFKFSNAETNDLLTEIEALGFEFDVKQIMQTWTEQMGLPVVQVTKVSDTEYKLTQTRFLSNPEDAAKEFNDSPFNYRWSIPITFYTSANKQIERKWFNYNDAELTLSIPSDVNWIKFNVDQVGYYRVNYPEDEWKKLTTALVETPERFSISDRAHLLNDAFALADATQLSYDVALDLTKYLEKEVDYVPWSVASSKLISLANILRYTDVFKNYAHYGRKLVNSAYNKVTWNVGTEHLDNLLRVTILNAACSLGHEECLKEVSSKFNEWLSNPEQRPNPDIRQTVYYYGKMTSGTEKTWEQVWEVFKAELDANEKNKLMKGLAGIKEPWILKRFIDLAWDESNVRGQDYFACLQNIAQNPVGESLVWDYVRENWEKLVDRFGLNERYLGRMIPSITGRFSTNLKLEEMETFFAKYPEAGAGTAARKQALENVKNNIKWLAANKDKVSKWLLEQQE